MGGKIQDADIKSVAELVAAGATAASLPNDDKIWITANSILKTLKQAIIDGDLSGGGGGSSLDWSEGEDSPTPVFENNVQTYKFAPTEQQQLFTTYLVPQSYNAGNPIKVRMTFYASEGSNNYGFATLSALVRTGVDLITSTANQHTGTQTGALSAPLINKPRSLVFDITDGSGLINGVSPSPGDLIRIKLFEQGSTGSDDLTVVIHGREVTIT